MINRQINRVGTDWSKNKFDRYHLYDFSYMYFLFKTENYENVVGNQNWK